MQDNPSFPNFCTRVHEIKLPDLHLGATQTENILHYLERSLSKNTRIAYSADLHNFTNWGGRIPCSPEIVAAYLTDHAQTHAIATLSRWLVSISKAHTMQNLSSPVQTDLVKLTLRGIKREHGKPQKQADAILKEDLTVMLSYTPDSLRGHRDKALLILGFCAALRRSELCAVKFEDLEFNSQGMILTLPRSKTDQTGQGRKIAIPYGRGKICPVNLVKSWIEISGIQSGSLFISIRKGGILTSDQLSDRSIANLVKHYASKAGLEAEKYSSHSLRSGLCTSASQHGVSSWKIKAQSGHRSDASLARYIRIGDLFTDNASAALF